MLEGEVGRRSRVEVDGCDQRTGARSEGEPPTLLQAHSRLLPLSVATWNNASLFGTIAAGPQRRRQKWRVAQKMVEGHDVIVFQDTRGGPGDLATLPSSHVWYGPFLVVTASMGGSTGGGCVVGVYRRWVRLHPRIVHQVLCCGRAHSVSCMPADLDHGLFFVVNVHIELASTIATKRRIIDSILVEMTLRPRSAPFSSEIGTSSIMTIRR